MENASTAAGRMNTPASSAGSRGAGGAPGSGGVQLETQVFQFTTSVSKFRKLTAVLGTRRDTHEQRLKITAMGNSLKESAKDISEGLKAGQDAGADAFKHSKLVHDFQDVLRDFQRVHRACLEKMSLSSPQTRPAPSSRAGGRGRGGRGPFASGGPSRQSDEGLELLEAERMESQLLVDDEIEFHDVLIEEREKGIREIQNQVAEVGEIFQDLAVLVNEQGDMVDDIESHITSTHANTDQAGREIGRAASHQKGARNRLCVSAVLCVVMLVILLIIFNA